MRVYTRLPNEKLWRSGKVYDPNKEQDVIIAFSFFFCH
jgi:hypothetical protein